MPTPITDPGAPVQWAAHGGLRRIILNRPHAVNALTTPMVEAIDAWLTEWANDPAVTGVTVEGNGSKGLCAGGDVVAVRRAVLDGGDHLRFFAREYAMNQRIAAFAKPLAVFQDGLVLGGGVGVSAHAGLRVVTPRTRVAMPETNIGFFPDVGATYLLARAPGETGTYAAMTSAMMTGSDAIHLGLADGMIPQDAWPDLLDRLNADPGYHVSRPAEDHLSIPHPIPPLAAEQGWIDEAFAGDDPAAIVERLRERTEPAAVTALGLIEARSPFAACVALEAIRRAAALPDVNAVLAQDLRVADAMVRSRDFAEGVRALLVDKDRSPHWEHTSVADVPREQVSAVFA